MQLELFEASVILACWEDFGSRCPWKGRVAVGVGSLIHDAVMISITINHNHLSPYDIIPMCETQIQGSAHFIAGYGIDISFDDYSYLCLFMQMYTLYTVSSIVFIAVLW